jgi:hypothetical protein
MKNSIINISIYLLTITVISCSKEPDTLKQPNIIPFNSKGISMSLIKDSIIADGVSNAEFFLKMDSNTTKYYNEVVFSVQPIGLFSNASDTQSTTFDANGEAKVFINSSAKGLAIVKADIINLCTINKEIHFTTSFPDQILIQPAVSEIPSSLTSNATITAKLVRVNGSVSKGVLVNFYDSTATNKSIGVFINSTTSNNSGECTTTYSIQDTSYHGLVYIKGSVNVNKIRIIGFSKILIQ